MNQPGCSPPTGGLINSLGLPLHVKPGAETRADATWWSWALVIGKREPRDHLHLNATDTEHIYSIPASIILHLPEASGYCPKPVPSFHASKVPSKRAATTLSKLAADHAPSKRQERSSSRRGRARMTLTLPNHQAFPSSHLPPASENTSSFSRYSVRFKLPFQDKSESSCRSRSLVRSSCNVLKVDSCLQALMLAALPIATYVGWEEP